MALYITTHPSLLPFLTALIGTGGFTVGIYSFINPTAAARIYGLPLLDAVHEHSLTNVLGTGASRSKNPIPAPSTTRPSNQTISLIHALGIRNFTAGLTILSLTSYWHFFLAEGLASAAVREAVQRALGIVILVGALVPLVDAWVCLQHSRDVYIGRVTVHEHDIKAWGEEKDLWKEYRVEHEAYVTGRKAGTLHAARSLIWFAGGIWCLLG